MFAYFGLAILGIILIVIGLFSIATFKQGSLPLIGLGLVFLFIGSILGALNIFFQFFVDWWFITVPTTIFVAGFLVHRYFFRRI